MHLKSGDSYMGRWGSQVSSHLLCHTPVLAPSCCPPFLGPNTPEGLLFVFPCLQVDSLSHTHFLSSPDPTSYDRGGGMKYGHTSSRAASTFQLKLKKRGGKEGFTELQNPKRIFLSSSLAQLGILKCGSRKFLSPLCHGLSPLPSFPWSDRTGLTTSD